MILRSAEVKYLVVMLICRTLSGTNMTLENKTWVHFALQPVNLVWPTRIVVGNETLRPSPTSLTTTLSQNMFRAFTLEEV